MAAVKVTNGAHKGSAVRDGVFNTPCTMPVPIQNAPRSEGGLGHDSAILWGSAHFVYVIAPPLLACNSPASPCRTSGKRQDGSDPPFFASVSANGEGGVGQALGHRPSPFFGGRSRPIDPCGKAPNTDHKRALTRRRQVL